MSINNSTTAVYCRLSGLLFLLPRTSMLLFLSRGRKRRTVGGPWLTPDTDGLTDGIHCRVCVPMVSRVGVLRTS